MNLLDALSAIEEHLRPGMTVDCWMLESGEMIRRVIFNDGESYARTNTEWEAAIKATAILAGLPTTQEDYEARDNKTPNAQAQPTFCHEERNNETND